MLNIGRSARTSAGEVSLLEKQTRAFGTTIRYAFAGSVLFGMTSMIGKLNELQQQMGLMAAIAGPSGTNLRGGVLSDMEDEIIEKSVEARTSVSELNAATINFLSTVQKADPATLPDIVSQIGLTAKISQTPTEDLTKAMTTMNVAAGRHNNLRNLNGELRQWFHLISTAPGGIAAAPQIAQQLGPLAAVMMGLGPSTPEQMMGLALGSLKFGATPSVALRGLQYFTQSLFQPPSEQSKEALKRAGFSPERLQKEGPARFILDYLQYVSKLGKTSVTKGGLQRLTALGQAADFTGQEELMPNINIEGLSPRALEFMRTTLGRIHGIRTAAVLLRQIDPNGPLPSIQELIKQMDNLNKGVGNDAKDLEQAQKDYQNQTPLLGAATALDALRVTISRDLQAILNPAARGITAGAQALQDRPNLRTGLEIGVGTLLASMGIGAAMGGKVGVGRFLGKFRGVAGQTVVTGMAARDIADVGLGASPMNPLYVIVVGQIFGGQGPGGGRSIVEDAAKVGGAAWLWRTIRTKGPGALTKFGIPFTAAWMASDWVGGFLGLDKKPDIFSFRNWKQGLGDLFGGDEGMARWQRLSERRGKFPRLWRFATGLDKPSPSEQHVLNQFGAGQMKMFKAEERLKRISMRERFDELNRINSLSPTGMFKAEGEIDININMKSPTGKTTTKRKKLSASVYSGGKVPTARGRKKSVRADFDPREVLPEFFGGNR
jgi:hypothetical protein